MAPGCSGDRDYGDNGQATVACPRGLIWFVSRTRREKSGVYEDRFPLPGQRNSGKAAAHHPCAADQEDMRVCLPHGTGLSRDGRWN